MSVSIGTLCLELAACAQTAQANVVGAAQPVELSLARRTRDTKTHFALKVRKKERERHCVCVCVCVCVLGNVCIKVTSLHVPMGAASWAACCISVFGCDLAARANALDGVLWLDELSDCICLSTSSSVSILIPSAVSYTHLTLPTICSV